MDALIEGLRDLAITQDNDAQNIESSTQLIQSGEPAAVLAGVKRVRCLLSREAKPPIDAILETGILPTLINIANDPMTAENSDLQFEVTWALTNIASGSTAHVRTLLDHGVLDPAVKALKHGLLEHKSQATWLLSNIAGDCAEYRNQVIYHGESVLETMTVILENSEEKKVPVSLKRNFAFLVSNCLRGKPNVNNLEVELGALRVIDLLLSGSDNDNEVTIDACWGLSYYAQCTDDSEEKRISAMLQCGLLEKLHPLVTGGVKTIVLPCLRVLGNVCSGADHHTQAIVDMDYLSVISSVMHNDGLSSCLQECVFILSNIAAGTHAQIQKLIESGLLPRVISQLIQAANSRIQHEAGWVCLNILQGGNTTQVNALKDSGGLQAACVVLQRLHEQGTPQGDQMVSKLVKVLMRILRQFVSKDAQAVMGVIDNLQLREILQEFMHQTDVSFDLP